MALGLSARERLTIEATWAPRRLSTTLRVSLEIEPTIVDLPQSCQRTPFLKVVAICAPPR
jgi:hypothetical protein